MTKITINTPGSGGSTSPGGSNKAVQYNDSGSFGGDSLFNFDETNTYVGIGTASPDTNLTVEGSAQCVARFESTGTGGGIDLKDNTTTANNQVGVGALGDDLCFRSGGAAAGNMRLLSTGTLTLFTNQLINFTPGIESGGALIINSSNQDQYNSKVYSVAGAVNIQIENSVINGFNITVYQTDANQCTIVAGSGLTLRNRLGNSKSAGQYAVISIVRIGNDLVLTGDTGA